MTFADEQIATAVKGVGFVELLGRKVNRVLWPGPARFAQVVVSIRFTHVYT